MTTCSVRGEGTEVKRARKRIMSAHLHLQLMRTLMAVMAVLHNIYKDLVLLESKRNYHKICLCIASECAASSDHSIAF